MSPKQKRMCVLPRAYARAFERARRSISFGRASLTEERGTPQPVGRSPEKPKKESFPLNFQKLELVLV